MSLFDLVSREVAELPNGVEKSYRFAGVEVWSKALKAPVAVKGPVPFQDYEGIDMELTNPRTGMKDKVKGIRFLVTEEDGQKVDKPLNVVSKRLIAQLQYDLENGQFTRLLYRITAVGASPKTTYHVKRENQA